MSNTNYSLRKAHYNKNDEFYTIYEDIEIIFNPIWYYLKDKVILCNCNDTDSNFYSYFHKNFSKIGLKKLICTGFGENNNRLFGIGGSCKIYDGSGNDENLNDCIYLNLSCSGSYKSTECKKFLQECDIVITNPPFSEIIEYYETIRKFGCDFIFFGTLNFIYTRIASDDYVDGLLFPYNIWSDKYKSFKFIMKNGEVSSFSNICLFTNVREFYKPFKISIDCLYNEKNYKKLDGTDTIFIESINDIPKDYYGLMAVPLNFICYIDFDKFVCFGGDYLYYNRDNTICGKKIYARLIIKRIKY